MKNACPSLLYQYHVLSWWYVIYYVLIIIKHNNWTGRQYGWVETSQMEADRIPAAVVCHRVCGYVKWMCKRCSTKFERIFSVMIYAHDNFRVVERFFPQKKKKQQQSYIAEVIFTQKHFYHQACWGSSQRECKTTKKKPWKDGKMGKWATTKQKRNKIYRKKIILFSIFFYLFTILGNYYTNVG